MAQPTQTVRGTVTEAITGMPIPSANLRLLPIGQEIAADTEGNFIFTAVPVGRYDLVVTAVGYEPAQMEEIPVSSGKEVVIQIRLHWRVTSLDEIEIRPVTGGRHTSATVSNHVLGVEAAQRFAGGFDDPARLVTAFAGVSGNIGNNAFMVRGNSPQALQWKMEGIEIPVPNHLGDMRSFAGGTVTALSTQLLGNSTFLSGAMPAEYSNALSGVFDLSLRNGNDQQYEHTFQVGVVGIDLASEGPLNKGTGASYNINYRYSTLALVAPLLAEGAGAIQYQDLSFKLHVPTRKAGEFSFWGMGLIDRVGAEAKRDITEWAYDDFRETHTVRMDMGVAGLTHRQQLNKSQYWKTSLAATIRGLDYPIQRLDSSLNEFDKNALDMRYRNIVLSSFIGTKINARINNKTGVNLTNMQYDMDIRQAPRPGDPMQAVVDETGSSNLLAAYTHFSFRPAAALTMHAGLNASLFTLNNRLSIEPRLGIRYQVTPRQSLALAYGLHSRLERLNYYFVQDPQGRDLNKELDFTKAHHLVLGYDLRTSATGSLKAELYYQHLFDVPVVADSSFSLLNQQTYQFDYAQLENTGLGRNVGFELTYNRGFASGYYYMANASIFSSTYRGGDQVWRDTRYNRNFAFNLLMGKEWDLGRRKHNLLGVNGRISYQGGDRYSPVSPVSIPAQQVIYDETNAFSEQYPAALTAHLTVSYRINKKKTSQEISLKILNLTQFEEYVGHRYNYQTRQVEVQREPVVIPNLSYRIDF